MKLNNEAFRVLDNFQLNNKVVFTEKYLDNMVPHLQDHKLEGLLFSSRLKDSLSIKTRNDFAAIWQEQWIRNHLHIKEVKRIEKLFLENDIEATLLKGMSLIGDIYDDFGARFMCDIDLLVDPKDFDVSIKVLKNDSYKEIKERKWAANNFKYTLQKTFEYPINIEIHSRLFYQHDKSDFWEKCPSHQFTYFKVLAHHDQLAHLLGHLGYQHSCLKLHWFIDIDRYIRKHKDVIDWDKLKKKLRTLKQTRSAEIILWALNTYMHTPVPKELMCNSVKKFIYKKIFTPQYLWCPDKFLRYYLVKYLCKDQFRDSFIYNMKWLQSKLIS